MERKYYWLIGLFLTVVLVTHVIIFTPPVQGGDDCDRHCINYWVSGTDPPEQHANVKLSGVDPQFPCFYNTIGADEIVIEDSGYVIYHLTGGLPERIKYGGPPLELSDVEYNPYRLEFYKAGQRLLYTYFIVQGKRYCPTTTTSTPVSTTTVPNTSTTTTTDCVICLGDSQCCGDPDCCSHCCEKDKKCCGAGECCFEYEACCDGECCVRGEICSSSGQCVLYTGPWDCLLNSIYGEGSEEVELLRAFRDEVLSQSPVGQEIIELYYMWSPTIAKVMEEDEEFKENVKEMIDGMLELIVEEGK
jgi:hypothetical protein